MVCRFSSAIARAMVLGLLLPAAAGASVPSAIAEHTHPPRVDVLFEPTPHAIVDAMLRLAEVGPADILIDLGSGDGRIPIAAARTYGAKAVGVDLDPRRVREARENAERRGVAGKVDFVEGDLFSADISKATVIALFLSPEANRKLRPRLLDLAPGTRIVSHEHNMGAWQPDKTAARRSLGGYRVFSWVVPAKVDGAWQVRVGERAIDVRMRQTYQWVDGSAVVDGREYPIRNGRLRGAQISLDLPLGGGNWRRLRGLVTPTEIRGEDWVAGRPG
jgi:SAM-dependent methyltransferase